MLPLRFIRPGLLLLTLACFSTVATAAERTATYDIRDLLFPVPDFTEAGPPATQPSRDAMVNDVVATLQDLLSKDATFRELNGQLVVTADEAGHRLVGAFFETARRQRSLQLMTEARVVRMPVAVFAALPDDLRITIKVAALQHGREPAELSPEQTAVLMKLFAGGSGGANPALPAAAEFNKNAKPPAECSTLTTPRLTTFNHQAATVVVTTDTNFIQAYWGVTGTDGKMEIQPEIGTAKAGVTFTLRGRTHRDAATSAVQMKLVVDRLLRMESVATEDGNVQKPILQKITFAGLYNVPRDRTLLLMPTDVTSDKPTDAPAALADPAGLAGTDLTFALLKITPIVQREVEEAKPLLAEPPVGR